MLDAHRYLTYFLHPIIYSTRSIRNRCRRWRWKNAGEKWSSISSQIVSNRDKTEESICIQARCKALKEQWFPKDISTIVSNMKKEIMRIQASIFEKQLGDKIWFELDTPNFDEPIYWPALWLQKTWNASQTIFCNFTLKSIIVVIFIFYR